MGSDVITYSAETTPYRSTVTYAAERRRDWYDECLNEHWFTSLADACWTIGDWRLVYNESHPHG